MIRSSITILLAICCVGLADDHAVVSWREVRSFLYQLQNADPAKIAKTKFDLVVMDYSRDGSDGARFSAKEIAMIQRSAIKSKRVLAYLSIGEAEDYRGYWQKNWDANHDGKPDAGAPSWLGPQNPDWPGNYKVCYWDPAWQKIVMDYVDKIAAAGFDGVYLDVIDAYQYWHEEGTPRQATAEQEMVEFVKAIATHAREKLGKREFAVFVQNAEELSSHADYVETVTGIGREDLFFNGDRRQKKDETDFAIEQLDHFKKAGKLVLSVDYVTKHETIDEYYKLAESHGYVPYATRRGLDRLTINAGHEPK